MTVKELIEANACIVEAYITLRGDYVRGVFSEGEYVHEFGVGSSASFGRQVDSARQTFGKGLRGSRFSKPYTLISKEINARAKHPYWSVLTNVFPKSVLDLEVTSWETTGAYSWRRFYNSVGYESACVIRIECWLPEEKSKTLRIEAEPKQVTKECEQISLFDFDTET